MCANESALNFIRMHSENIDNFLSKKGLQISEIHDGYDLAPCEVEYQLFKKGKMTKKKISSRKMKRILVLLEKEKISSQDALVYFENHGELTNEYALDLSKSKRFREI
jgi:hypothetical protein